MYVLRNYNDVLSYWPEYEVEVGWFSRLYFGLQQPRSAAAAVTAAARPPPLTAGDHGDCGAYSVSILRQGPLPSRESAAPYQGPTCHRRTIAESESSHSGVDASRQQLNSSHHANSDRQALKQLMGLKWCW